MPEELICECGNKEFTAIHEQKRVPKGTGHAIIYLLRCTQCQGTYGITEMIDVYNGGAGENIYIKDNKILPPKMEEYKGSIF